jgi:hypothetical protein
LPSAVLLVVLIVKFILRFGSNLTAAIEIPTILANIGIILMLTPIKMPSWQI